MRLFYSEYQKVFIQIVYNSSSLTQPRGERKTLSEYINLSRVLFKRATHYCDLIDSHQCLTQHISSGFQTQPPNNPKLSFLL